MARAGAGCGKTTFGKRFWPRSGLSDSPNYILDMKIIKFCSRGLEEDSLMIFLQLVCCLPPPKAQWRETF